MISSVKENVAWSWGEPSLLSNKMGLQRTKPKQWQTEVIDAVRETES